MKNRVIGSPLNSKIGGVSSPLKKRPVRAPGLQIGRSCSESAGRVTGRDGDLLYFNGLLGRRSGVEHRFSRLKELGLTWLDLA